MSRSLRLLGLSLGAILVVGACSASATATPTVAPTGTPAATSTASGSTAPTATPAPSATPLASIPAGQLIFPTKLVICSDIPYPPQEFFDDQGNPIGSDIEIGQTIAQRLGLQPEVQNSVFDTIITALTGGKCDIIISAQNITSDRIKQVDMIPYFQAGQSFVVAAGNPKGIKVQNDLCGKTVGAESGTTEADYVQGTGDYKGQGLTAACTKAGLAAITLKQYQKDSDALLALQSGVVDAYFADSPVAGYYTVQHPDQFALSGLTLGVALEGISVAQTNKDLRDAVQKALIGMINDGTYLTILKKYGDDPGAITADIANQLNKTQ
ncbi:MAG TPA: transporter substrate-binding domain-containing protein [Candidatus Limnocylindrales bacterium]|jgi:polar amino acid transport system substrate-binding protein